MATSYYLDKRFDSEFMEAVFNAVRSTLNFEHYPNGNSGWTDRSHELFEACGFRLVRRTSGNAHVAASAAFAAPVSEIDLGDIEKALTAYSPDHADRLVWPDGLGRLSQCVKNIVSIRSLSYVHNQEFEWSRFSADGHWIWHVNRLLALENGAEDPTGFDVRVRGDELVLCCNQKTIVLKGTKGINLRMYMLGAFRRFVKAQKIQLRDQFKISVSAEDFLNQTR